MTTLKSKSVGERCTRFLDNHLRALRYTFLHTGNKKSQLRMFYILTECLFSARSIQSVLFHYCFILQSDVLVRARLPASHSNSAYGRTKPQYSGTGQTRMASRTSAWLSSKTALLVWLETKACRLCRSWRAWQTACARVCRQRDAHKCCVTREFPVRHCTIREAVQVKQVWPRSADDVGARAQASCWIGCVSTTAAIRAEW